MDSPSLEASAPADFEFSKKLIQLVKDQPLLYDKTFEDFKDEGKKTEAWNTIAERLNLSADEIQVRWARLRVDFGRHRRKRQTAAACGAQIRNWPLYELLRWLAPHIKMRAKRDKHKNEKITKLDTLGYKPILPRPNWLINVDGGVSVDVSPSIVVQNGHEDVTESFIVSPDTADYDDAASPENSGKAFTGKWANADVEDFMKKHDLKPSQFAEEMRAALGTQSKSVNFIYSLENEIFSWKKRYSNGLVARLGQVKLKKVPVIDSYETVLDKSLERLNKLQEAIESLENSNCSLRKDRDEALNKVNELAKVKTEWEKKLYGQFVAVLNAKKERIIALEEMLDVQIADPDTRAPSSRTAVEEEHMEAEEDPYAGDTDVDSDAGDGGDAGGAPVASTSAASSSALRRRRDIFQSFDSSPGSPSPMLPKRSRGTSGTAEATTASSSSASASTGGGLGSARNVFRDVFEEADGEEDDGDEVQAGESTQDILDCF